MCIRLGFSWNVRTSAAQKADLLFTKLWIKPVFPSLADEIAEPRPDMNIQVAAFTVSEDSFITYNGLTFADCHINQLSSCNE